MTDFVVVFLTGLTTGGLSCLAVQGGLLASSIAHQAEQDTQQQLATKVVSKQQKKRRVTAIKAPTPAPSLALPIWLFLGSKLVTYTLLGLLLGWLGSVLQLTPLMRAILQLSIGIFMVGTALRMFNVHPIFRYFVIEPPSALTRYIRRTAKNSTHDIATPLFLGALTVLIPCGVTQAMMALAIGTGSPLAGAAIMFAFVLGTSPVFFTLAYLATRLGQTMESRFLQIAAVAVLILGMVSIDGGLNLMGSPLAPSNLANQVASVVFVTPQDANQLTASSFTANQTAIDGVVSIQVSNGGYAPQLIHAPANQPIKLSLVTNKTVGCTRAFVIPALNVQKILPDTGTTTINVPAQAAGKTLRFTCSMGMYSGQIQFS